jgi:hypothetical protein
MHWTVGPTAFAKEHKLSTTPPALNTETVVAAQSTHKKVTCEFCACVLTPNGEIVTMSDIARGYRDQLEKHKTVLETKEKEAKELREQLTAKDAEIAELKGSSSPKRKFLK